MRIGIDMGGTKIEGIVIDARGHECARLRTLTPTGDYSATVRAVAGLVDVLANQTNLATDVPLGIGIPGTVSPTTGLIKNANSTCLIGKRLDHDLTEATGRAVRLANDANCFVVSEATDGAGAGHAVIFGVILGTGVGGAICIDGKLMNGLNAIAGEWGHNPLPWPQVLDGHDERDGEPCYCGQSGCIETFLSGPGLCRDYERHIGQYVASDMITNEATLKRYEHRLARSLATILNVLDPDLVVLGGGLSNMQRLYENVPKLWHEWIFSDTCTTSLVPNVHGDSSGVRGAAWLWPAKSEPTP